MNAHTQTLQDLCFKNPALRRLLQFDLVESTAIAELQSATIHFSILFNKNDDNFMVHYRCHNHRPSWENSPEGYVRCSNFEEVLEALNDEIQEHHLSHGSKGRTSQQTLWLSLQPIHIAAAFRHVFSTALAAALEQMSGNSQSSRLSENYEQWSSFLHHRAMSA